MTGRKASKTQSKLAILEYGAPFSGKTTLALQLAYFKNPDGSPFKVMFIDGEGGGADDYLSDLEANGVDLNNIYMVYTQSLSEVQECIRKAKNGEEFYELDENGNETDEVVVDGDGKPFKPDALVIDGATVLNLSTKQSLVEFSKKRSSVRAKNKGLVGEERLVAIDGAFLELKDWNVLAFKGQNLVLDLTIGIVGMNEMCENFFGENNDILTDNGKQFCIEVGQHIRKRLLEFQQETGNLYNFEATPAESTAFRLAKKDKEEYPDIITRGTVKAPYYTNSCHIPVNKIVCHLIFKRK